MPVRSSSLCASFAAIAAFAPSLAGQRSYGDSLLAAGNLTAAESAYYAAVRVKPRDPQARRQLGRFLAERGALRVGAVLLEEARQFGGDAATIARDLVPLYRALGDYRALTTLPSTPLSAGERAQAVWLVDHPPALEGADTATVVYRPPADAATLGRMVLTIDNRSVEASIDPTRRGIIIDPRAAIAGRVRRFPARADGSIPGVADSLRIGALKLVNVPVRLDSLPARADAIIGIDVVQRYAPSFDPRAGRVTLRPTGTVEPTMPGVRIPTLTSASDVRVVQAGRLTPISAPSFASLLRTKRWTLDGKRGTIIIE
jgi:hypothetical protein